MISKKSLFGVVVFSLMGVSASAETLVSQQKSPENKFAGRVSIYAETNFEDATTDDHAALSQVEAELSYAWASDWRVYSEIDWTKALSGSEKSYLGNWELGVNHSGKIAPKWPLSLTGYVLLPTDERFVKNYSFYGAVGINGVAAHSLANKFWNFTWESDLRKSFFNYRQNLKGFANVDWRMVNRLVVAAKVTDWFQVVAYGGVVSDLPTKGQMRHTAIHSEYLQFSSEEGLSLAVGHSADSSLTDSYASDGKFTFADSVDSRLFVKASMKF